MYLSLLIPIKLHQAMKLNMKHRNPHKWTQTDLSRISGDCLLVQVFLRANHHFCENHPSIKSPDDPSGQQESPIHRMLLSCSTETACKFILPKLQCKCLRNRAKYPKIQSACERTHWNHIFSAAHDLFSSLPDWALNPASMAEISASLKLCVSKTTCHIATSLTETTKAVLDSRRAMMQKISAPTQRCRCEGHDPSARTQKGPDAEMPFPKQPLSLHGPKFWVNSQPQKLQLN